jgi:hypothetical protein
MAATTRINEYNGSAAGTVTNAVARGDWLSAEVASNSDLRNTYPITLPGAGTNYSYEKWHKLEVTAMNDATSVGTIRHYLTAALPTGYLGYTSAQSGTPSNPSGTTPIVTQSTIATTAMPTSDPAVSTISGTLTGTGTSGFVVTQLRVGTTAAAGFENTVRWAWYENV